MDWISILGLILGAITGAILGPLAFFVLRALGII